MSIFSSKKTVVGLFSDDKNVERAINELTTQGFGEEDKLRVIDNQRLAGGQEPSDTPVMPAASTGMATQERGMAVPVGVTGNVSSEQTMVRETAADELTDLGVNEEEASFYADKVARGGKVVVVETTEDRLSQALDIIKKIEPQTSVS